MRRPTNSSDTIIVDEIGIETGRHAGFLLKSAYQPVFRREGGMLTPFAVEGSVLPFLDGRPVPPQRLLAQTPPDDRLFVECMCRTLHIRNYRNIGMDGLQLLIGFDLGIHTDAGSAISEIRFLAKHLVEIGLANTPVVCKMAESALSAESAVRLRTELRRHGFGIAIDSFGGSDSDIERLDRIQPDIAKIDGGWFRKVSQVAETARLLPALVAGVRERGIAVLIGGIETAWQLRTALEAGADFFQGNLLGSPALAGTIFDEATRSIEELTRVPDNVVLLRR